MQQFRNTGIAGKSQASASNKSLVIQSAPSTNDRMSEFKIFLDGAEIVYENDSDSVFIPEFTLDGEGTSMIVASDPDNGHLIFEFDGGFTAASFCSDEVVKFLNLANDRNPVGAFHLDPEDFHIRFRRELRVGAGISNEEYMDFLEESTASFFAYAKFAAGAGVDGQNARQLFDAIIAAVQDPSQS